MGIDRAPHWRMAMNCHTLVYDQVKLSWFKVIEWCQGFVDPVETWWNGLIPKEFIPQRPPWDSKGILRSLYERLILDVPYYHNCLWALSMSSWSNGFSSQMCMYKNSRTLFFLLYIYIYIYIYIYVCIYVCMYVCI